MASWLWTGLAALLLLLLAILALLSTVKVRVRYSHSGKFDQLVLVVRAAYGIVRLRTVVPLVGLEGMHFVYRQQQSVSAAGADRRREAKRKIGWGTLRRSRRALGSIRASTREFGPWVRRSLRKVECTRWRTDVTVGTGEAASTAVLTGLLWSATGCLAGLAARFVKLRAHPHGSVRPVYAATEFTLVWEADFRIRAGTAVLCLLRLGGRTVRLRQAYRAWRVWLRPSKRA